MSFWDIASYAAWGISGLILTFLLFDAFRVSKEYDEDLMMHSIDEGNQGGHGHE